jgi:hypothetical protein
MKVALSVCVEADIANQLQHGVNRFGQQLAERTFARVDAFLSKFLLLIPIRVDTSMSKVSTRLGSQGHRSSSFIA